MSLTSGSRVGPYTVTEKIGEGGMGEVYRGRDPRLDRDVALKVLSTAFARDVERIARFEREAKTLAALNDPSIAQIYGLEQSIDGLVLVMEYVDGEDLAERLHRGPLPVDEAITIADHIAHAIEAAHRRGIMHRDLKPANIKLSADGGVKVLDFGLAKTIEAHEHDSPSAQAATITSPAAVTAAGVVVGTAAYMSPEQAKGRAADSRSDVWAFGCVLYEMLSGRRAFAGEDVAETIVAILRSAPDWSLLPSTTPPSVRALLVEALEKDRSKRLSEIGVARYLLKHAADTVATTQASTVRRHSLSIAASVAAGMIATIAIGFMAGIWPAGSSAPALPVTRSRIVFRSGTSLLNPNSYNDLAVAPDGRRIVYIGLNEAGRQQLYSISPEELDPRPIDGFEAGVRPFFSPDGKWIAVHAGGRNLLRIPADGGAAVKVCDATGTTTGTWLPDDTIVFSQGATGLWRVPASGGAPVLVTTIQTATETSHTSPTALPDGRHVLFTIGRTANFDEGAIGIADVTTGEHRVLLEGGMSPQYITGGYIVFGRARGLYAVRFDVKTMEVSGAPVMAIDDVYVNGTVGFAQFAASSNGLVVYAPYAEGSGNRSLVWVDRRGAVTPIAAAPQGYEFPRLSPDGRHIAVSITGSIRAARRDIWIYEIARGTLMRLTSERGEAETPVWTPDGSRVTYAIRFSLPGVARWRHRTGVGQRRPRNLFPQRRFNDDGGGRYHRDGIVAERTNDVVWRTVRDRHESLGRPLVRRDARR